MGTPAQMAPAGAADFAERSANVALSMQLARDLRDGLTISSTSEAESMKINSLDEGHALAPPSRRSFLPGKPSTFAQLRGA